MKFLIIEDSVTIAHAVQVLLESAGHQAVVRNSPVQALQDVAGICPDVILLDLMMPEMDGFEVLARLRGNPEFSGTKIVILSSKAYESDKRRTRQLGANGFISKPFRTETFFRDLDAIITRTLTLTYWGTRGTLPVPGPGSLRYGGNTSCVTLEAKAEPLLIFDAGSGIKKLSDHLMAEHVGRLTAKILVTHPHWDHINALPFFAPLYVQGNEIEIMGSPQGDLNMFKIMTAQMDDLYFPVTIREFGARVFFRDLREESIKIGGFSIETMLLNHQGNCLGYRVGYDGRSVCFITDNELFPKDSAHYNPEFDEKLTAFVHGADVLITDTTYLDEEYPAKIRWGHSCAREVATLAARAQVKCLHLFHHEPDQSDDAIDSKLAQVQGHLADLKSPVECICPAEGGKYLL